MTTYPSATAPASPASPLFVRWALEVLRVAPPSTAHDTTELRFDIAATGVPLAHIGGRRVAVAENDPQLWHWIIAQLQVSKQVQHAQPRDDDTTYEALTAALLSAYEFSGGEIDITNYTGEQRPVLRLTFLRAAADDASLHHAYLWPDGEELDDALVSALRLDDIAPLPEPPPSLDQQRVRRWIDTSLMRERRNVAAEELVELVVATVIWCRYASGKIAFCAGESRVEQAFSGWQKLLASGEELPPAYDCPLTGVGSRRLGLASDGRIVPLESLGTCEATQRILLLSEMERCHESGQSVARELLAPCMASGKLIQKILLKTCSLCHQPVAASALASGRCSACRALAPVRSDDPRMARVLGEYPKLDRWRRWQLSETESTYVLVTRSWVRQVLLVVHKETLTLLYAAVAGRIWSPWQEMSQLQRDDLLG